MNKNQSAKIWKKSLKYIVGGVNSPVRAYNSVGGQPIAIRSGKGCYITDEDGNEYLDFLNSWGPQLLGHSNKKVVKALKKQVKLGTSFGTITKKEMTLARLIVSTIKHIDLIRFVNSGTEAVMSALRLARAYTKKNKIIKFEGCYHGHFDGMLVQAGSGLLTLSGNISESSSPGIPESLANDTIVLPLDDEKLFKEVITKYKNEIAAVIIEPIPANSGLLPQRIEFLETLRSLTKDNNIILIFDEVISGFRLSAGGFCEKYNIIPDLVTYGKIIGGGLPVGAFAGRAEIMSNLAPMGKVYQAGTLSGNPLAMSAGIATLKYTFENNVYEKLNQKANYLRKQFNRIIKPILERKKDFHINLVQEESLFWLDITAKENADKPLRQASLIWSEASKYYTKIFWSMQKDGIHIAPSAYEVSFISEPMKKSDLDKYIKALAKALKKI